MTEFNLTVAEEALFVFLIQRLPLIFLFSLGTLAIQVLRSRLYGLRFYRPFLLNIILAWIPIVISVAAYVVFLSNDSNETILIWLLLIIWFFMYPNTIYLITEVHHFRDKTDVPLWFDTVAILSIVTNGVLLGSYSLAIIHFFVRTRVNNTASWLIILTYLLVANVGVYIGRNLRFNSWDVVKQPRRLLQGMKEVLSQKHGARDLVIYVVMFSFFLFVPYLLVEISISNLYGLGLTIDELRQMLPGP